MLSFLKTHEIELNEATKESTKKRKSIALKSTQKRTSSSKAMKTAKESEEHGKDSSDDEDDDEIAHLARRISKAWMRRKKKGLVMKKDKKCKAKQDEVICFECKEPGHVRSEYQRLKKNLKKKAPKKTAMMATWEDLDEEQLNTESQEKEEIVANICFMANIISKEETEVSDSKLEVTSKNLQKAYDDLLDDFQLLASYYASLKKNFQKLSLDFEKLKNENEILGHSNIELSKENSFL